MKVKVFNNKQEPIFEGDYLYLEAGTNKKGTADFHMSFRNFDTGEDMEVYFVGDEADDWKKITRPLVEQYDKEDKARK